MAFHNADADTLSNEKAAGDLRIPAAFDALLTQILKPGAYP